MYFKAQKNNVLNIFLTNNALLYLIIHLKFSTLFYSSQLSDMFAYELPFIGSSKNENIHGRNVVTNLKAVTQPSVVVFLKNL